MKISIWIVALLLVVGSAFAIADTGKVVIYKSDACSHCTPYVEKVVEALGKIGYNDIEIIDFINSKEERANLAKLQKEFEVPIYLQGHMAVYVDGNYLFEGHVPVDVMSNFLENEKQGHDRIVLVQDSMTGAKEYTIWKEGVAFSCGIGQNVRECEESRHPAVHDMTTELIAPSLIVLIPIALGAYYMAFRRK